ncbi:MAG TPA: sugar phosphate isomerase/epimerase family protein [Clostridiales bacterium]|nr:sugar phosphate isomerase/epimerase family protein [Clostridiales bacterium]
MKISAFSVCAPEYDVRGTIEVLKELGYDAVEWRTTNMPPISKPDTYNIQNRYWSYNLSTVDINRIDEIADEIGIMCKNAGLEICSFSTYLNQNNIDDINKVANAANIAGCKNIRLALPGYNKNENYRTQFNRAIKEVQPLEKIADRYKVRINFEMHPGNIIPSASAAYRFVSNFDPKYLGVIYDPGNMIFEGYEDYRMGIELLGEYLAYVHIKNAAWKHEGFTKDGAWIWKPSNAPTKRGCADLPGLINILKEKDYEGYLSIEDFSNEEDTYTKLKNNLEYLKKLTSNK